MRVETNFMGMDGFRWWMGVVEDRNDPLKLGRLRVRVLGTHTENKSLIKTQDLHWAYIYQPITSQAMNGLGTSPTGPAEGTWVFGFYRDGDSCQDPVIMGTMGGIPEDAPKPCEGFNDPSEPYHKLSEAPRKYYYRFYPNNGKGAELRNEKKAKLYPRTSHPWGNIVGEPDTNRLARGEMLDDTILGVKKRQRDVNIPISFSHTEPDRQWNEPESPAAPVYPYNHVYESESGHIMEFDDTPDKERFHLYHKSGTFIEIYGDPGKEGDTVTKVVGNNYTVILEKNFVHIQNACNVTIDGETNLYCRSDLNLQVDGNMKVHVKGNLEERVEGQYIQHVKGSREVVTDSNDTHDIKGNHAVKVGGNTTFHTGSTANFASGSTYKLSAGATMLLDAGGNIDNAAANIHMNTRGANPTSPSSPKATKVPAFPSPLGRKETIFESGDDPVAEEKPDEEPPTCPEPETTDETDPTSSAATDPTAPIAPVAAATPKDLTETKASKQLSSITQTDMENDRQFTKLESTLNNASDLSAESRTALYNAVSESVENVQPVSSVIPGSGTLQPTVNIGTTMPPSAAAYYGAMMPDGQAAVSAGASKAISQMGETVRDAAGSMGRPVSDININKPEGFDALFDLSDRATKLAYGPMFGMPVTNPISTIQAASYTLNGTIGYPVSTISQATRSVSDVSNTPDRLFTDVNRAVITTVSLPAMVGQSAMQIASVPSQLESKTNLVIAQETAQAAAVANYMSTVRTLFGGN